MPTTARVAVLPQEKGPLSIVEAVLPDPRPHEVVVRQFSSGVCHSQLHQIHNPRNSPVVLGHESTGVVIAKGSQVSHVKEGDSVMVTWVPRNKADNPQPTQPATLKLPDGTVAVSQNVFTWADKTIADEQYVVRIPDDAVKDVTSVIACAVITGAGAVLYTAGVKKGQSVAVFGAGGVGLCAIAAAKVMEADPIIAVDLDDGKLEFARRFGATATVNASKEDAVKAIRAMTERTGMLDTLRRPMSGVDFAFDCIGHKVTMEQILRAARAGVLGHMSGGTAVLVGVPQTRVDLNALDIMINEKKFIGTNGGSCQPDRDFPIFLDWHKSGKLDLNALVTQRYTLDQINEAVSALEAGSIQGRAILEF
ncbi:MAG: zinc-binding dehydrogenase [Deltaproteobacteria bacterium]|nr:zinc-binding dehydrogenase [Deltaproteobacteria bacterium]